MGYATGWKWLWYLVAGVVLAVLPFVLEKGFSQYYLYVAIKIIVWALFATSFNLVLGYGGMMSFGHAAFYGVSAYCCALLIVKASWPMPVAFLAGPVAAAIVGLVIGFFCVRIKGIFYFAVLSLSFAQLLYIVVYKWRSFTFGDDGVQGIPVPEIIETCQSYVNYYYFSLIITLLCLYVLWKIVKSPFGLMLATLRENPQRSTFIGMNVRSYRLIAFVISAFFSGVAGALFTLLETSISPEMLFWGTSGEVILMGLLGGMNIFLGPALGAGIMVMLNSFIGAHTQYWGLFIGATLILIVLVFPQGVGGLIYEKCKSRHAKKAT